MKDRKLDSKRLKTLLRKLAIAMFAIFIIIAVIQVDKLGGKPFQKCKEVRKSVWIWPFQGLRGDECRTVKKIFWISVFLGLSPALLLYGSPKLYNYLYPKNK